VGFKKKKHGRRSKFDAARELKSLREGEQKTSNVFVNSEETENFKLADIIKINRFHWLLSKVELFIIFLGLPYLFNWLCQACKTAFKMSKDDLKSSTDQLSTKQQKRAEKKRRKLEAEYNLSKSNDEIKRVS